MERGTVMNSIINFNKFKDDMEIGRFSFRFNGYDKDGRITFSLEKNEVSIQPESATIIYLPNLISSQNIIAFQD